MAGETGTTQLNVRMSSALKADGDAVLAASGMSPSRIVRSLWEAIAKNGDSLGRIMDVLEGDVSGAASHAEGAVAADSAVGPTVDSAIRGTELFAAGCVRLGLSESGAREADGRLWRSLREEAIEGRLAERGML